MILSRIGRSLSRSFNSAFGRNVIGNSCNVRGVRESVLPSALLESACISRVDGGIGVKLGIIRGYLTGVGGVRQLLSKNTLANSNSLLASPRGRLFFSTEGPNNRKYENYYPKDKKEIPKGNENKSGDKEGSGGGDGGGNFMKQFQNFIAPLLFTVFLYSSVFFGPQEQKQVTVLQYLCSFFFE